VALLREAAVMTLENKVGTGAADIIRSCRAKALSSKTQSQAFDGKGSRWKESTKRNEIVLLMGKL
jgi:hypothetical protein